MDTFAPPNFSLLLNFKLAPFLSKRVFPRNVPRPVPDFDDISWDLDLIYGSPRIWITSSGNPGPSSSMIIFTYSIYWAILSNYVYTINN